MVYLPHVRMTMLGDLPGGEIFSMSLSLDRPNPVPAVNFFGIDVTDALWNDLADDCLEWFVRPATKICARAVLQKVKFAQIGADGHYTAAPIEKLRTTGGGVSAATFTPPPNQVARAITLHTAGDLNRVKGRFYAPMPALDVGTDGVWSAANADAMEASDQTFINALNNQPGLDLQDIRVVVASQGRHNSDGSVRRGPANDVVTSISVGRVPDTIRRRRNKLSEGRTTVPVS